MSDVSNVQRAQAAWGSSMPDWIVSLAEACDASSQGKVAKLLDLSSAVVNKLVNRTYLGDPYKFEPVVRATFMPDEVDCPATGAQIPPRQCFEYRRGLKAKLPPLRPLFDRICPTCSHNLDRRGKSAPSSKE